MQLNGIRARLLTCACRLALLAGRPLALAGVLIAAGVACHTDLGIEETAFQCETSADCMEGWNCSKERGVCVEGLTIEVDDDDTCYVPFTRSVCDSDEYCMAGSDGYECVKSQCEETGDCIEGTHCVPVAPGFRICLPEGERQEAESCSWNTGEYCEPGLLCDSLGGEAQCVARCDPWEQDDCGSGQACLPRTPGLGTCWEEADNSGQVLATCDPEDEGQPCRGPAVCLRVANEYRCVKWCRPGHGVCPSFTIQQREFACNTGVVPGRSEMGLCTQVCRDDGDCQNSSCVQVGDSEHKFCRVRCETDADCPAYNGEGRWICRDKYCQ